MDLWNYQKLVFGDGTESPRTKVITGILKVVRKREAQNNRDNHVDRATNSMVNGYGTVEDVKKICISMYNSSEQTYRYGFRNSTAFLMAHYLLLRGESVRNIEFADLQFKEMPKIDADGTYPVMLMIFNQGKTNRFNKTQTGACMRNKVVEICPFMSMSFHLFYRWHCEREAFPDMSSNANWFKTKVIHGAKPKQKEKDNELGKQ